MCMMISLLKGIWISIFKFSKLANFQIFKLMGYRAPNYRNFIDDGDEESNRPETAFDCTKLYQPETEGENRTAPNIADEDIKKAS